MIKVLDRSTPNHQDASFFNSTELDPQISKLESSTLKAVFSIVIWLGEGFTRQYLRLTDSNIIQ